MHAAFLCCNVFFKEAGFVKAGVIILSILLVGVLVAGGGLFYYTMMEHDEQLQTLASDNAADSAELEARIQTLSAEAEKLREELASLTSDGRVKEAQNALLAAQVETLTASSADLNTQIGVLTTTV